MNVFSNATSFAGTMSDFTAMLLEKKRGFFSRVSREVESEYKTAKRGDKVQVRVPTVLSDAEEYDSSSDTITVTDVSETLVEVQLEKHFQKAAKLTSKDKALNMYDFAAQVYNPLYNSLMRTYEKNLSKKRKYGFASNLVGDAGTNPSTTAHIKNAVAFLKGNDIPYENGFVAGINTTTWGNLLELTEFKSLDYGGDRSANLAAGSLAPYAGIREFFDTQFFGTHDNGDDAGTILTNGVQAAGASSITLDGFTAATGTVYAGTRFTVAGQTTEYVVTADATKASNAATLSIYPSLSAEVADGVEITFGTEYEENILYHPAAVAAAIVAPEPLESKSMIMQAGGMSIRMSVVEKGLSELFVLDGFVGGRVTTPQGGVIMQGSSS